MERSNGRFDDQKTEMRRHPPLGLSTLESRNGNAIVSPARHSRLALLSALDSAVRKLPPLFALPLRWTGQV